MLAIRGRGRRGEATSTARGRPRWLVPLTLTFAGAVIAPRISPVRRALDTVVRCSSGHLFTTLWFPLGSFKAIRFGGDFSAVPSVTIGRWCVASRNRS